MKPPAKTAGLLLVWLCLFLPVDRAAAQISVGPQGVAPMTFDTLPPANSWSTRSVPGATADITTVAMMDAQVQTNDASLMATALVSSPGDPPSAKSLGLWASDGRYVLTRVTGNRFTLLMATLRNDTGTDPQQCSQSKAPELSNTVLHFTLQRVDNPRSGRPGRLARTTDSPRARL